MAIKIQELAFILKARDLLSPVLGKVTEQMEKINAQAKQTAWMREAAGNFAMMGAGALAAAGAVALPLGKAVSDYEQLQDRVARVATAMGDVPDKAEQLARAQDFVKREAVATGYGLDQLTESLYQGLSGFLNMKQAMAVSTEAAKLARGTSGDLADTTNALTTMMLNFGDATKTPIQNATTLADKMAALQTQFKFTNLTDLTYAMKLGAPAAKAFGVSFDQLGAALATLSAGGLTGETAGEGFMEIMTQMTRASRKLGFQVFAGPNGQGIDLLKTLQGIRDRFGDLGHPSAAVAEQFNRAFGRLAGERAMILLQHLDKYQDALKGLNNSSGAADRAFGEFQHRGTMAFAQLSQAIAVVEDSIGGALAPTIERVARILTSVATHIAAFAEKHATIVKYAVTFAAIAATLTAIVGGVLVLAGGLIAMASFLGIGGGILAVIAGIGVAVSAAAAAFVVWHRAIESAFGAMVRFVSRIGGAAYTAGLHFAQELARGIKAAALAPIHAVENVAHKIRAYLPFSPAETGPLRDLHRVRIVQTIAESIQPAPMLDAIRRVAQVAAVAVPMAIGGAAAPALAAPMARGGGDGVTINLSFAPTINAPSGDPAAIRAAVLDAARQHAHDLSKILDDYRARRARLRFDD